MEENDETTSIEKPCVAELEASVLCKYCDPKSLGFETTEELPDLQDVIGQPRALRALELGSGVSGPGYNIFVLGQPGSGRTTLSMEYLQRKALSEPVPDDWCYVNNFEKNHVPHALCLPAGRGKQFHKDLQELVGFAERELPRAFESEEYTKERDRLVNELKDYQETEFVHLQEYAEKFKFAIVRTPFGIMLVPAVQGKPLAPEEIANLSNEQRAKLEELQTKLGEEAEKTLKRLREVAHSTYQKLTELDSRTALFQIEPLIEQITARYADLPDVLNYLEAVQKDMAEHATDFRPPESGQSPDHETDWKLRYDVNLLVDHSETQGVPVILESQPAYYNLLGRIEHIMVMGASRTNFTMIRPGALHRANGGYLILSARDLLVNPYAWEGLKRVLRDGAIRIIELGSQLGIISTETLEPEPIPLDIKVILVGTPILYYLLRLYDEDFAKLFKVRAEFASVMDRNEETEREYGLFIKSVVVDNKLPNFDAAAVARIIEFSSRLADDQGKLTTCFGKITDLIREAAYWGRKIDPLSQDGLVNSVAVQRAIDEMIYRNNLLEERLKEYITQGTFLIDVDGSKIGQINALSIIMLGDYAFGRPSRLTASVHPGRAGVIDIERQAKLGGPIHTKGVMILSGYLAGQYGQKAPLNLTASLTFEQSYDEVEGDSASAAELFTILSALTRIPLRQDLAITGSISQHGQVQAIGGVNEKIEGFYEICAAKGLTGNQGVIIPRANLRHLMLNENLVHAVANGKFHIWPIETVNQGIALLAGMEPGEPDLDGNFPPETFSNKVIERLAEFADAVSALENQTGSEQQSDLEK